MTYFTGPFNSGGGANFDETSWREMLSALALDGVIKGALNTLAVTAGTGMSVNVDTGHAIGDGVYFRSDASVVVTVTASDPTNDRIDLICVHINLTGSTDSAGVTARSAAIIDVAGTPGGSPSAPSPVRTANTTWEIPLAQVRVPHGATTSASFTITTDNSSGSSPIRLWGGARVMGQSMSVFSGTTGGSNPTTFTHNLGETPNYFLLTPNTNVGTPARMAFFNQNASTVDIYCDTPGTAFVGLAIRQASPQ
jgi:hypothetical protein